MLLTQQWCLKKDCSIWFICFFVKIFKFIFLFPVRRTLNGYLLMLYFFTGRGFVFLYNSATTTLHLNTTHFNRWITQLLATTEIYLNSNCFLCSQEAFDLSILTVKSLSAPCRQYCTPTFSTRNPVKLDICNIFFQMEQLMVQEKWLVWLINDTPLSAKCINVNTA